MAQKDRTRRQNPYAGWKIFQDKKPPFRWRAYRRATRDVIDCEAFEPFSLAFQMEVHRINELHKEVQAKPGTLGMLIERYRANVFTSGDLASRTVRDYERCFDYLRPIADTPLTRFNSALVVKIRDKARTTRKDHFANYLVRVISLLFAWGKERGYVSDNPAAGIRAIRKKKGAPAANRPWTDAEREAVTGAMPKHMLLPFLLMQFYGLDPQDALGLPKTAVKDDRIDTRRGKTGQEVYLPLFEPVEAALRAMDPHDAITLCANSRGKPWTYNGYSTNWDRLKKTLEESGAIQPGLTLKGLRHTVATILREMGKPLSVIQLVLGHQTEAMARHYSRRADMTEQTGAAISDFAEELNKRKTKVVKL